jgi:DNA processing protein
MARDAWLDILQAAQANPRPWLDLIKRAGSPEGLLAESNHALASAGIGADAVHRLRSPDDELLDRWRLWLAREDRALVFFGAPEYPPLLANLADAPLALWLHGAYPELLSAPQLAIVGSRNPTHGGRQTAEEFAHYLCERGLTITSGLAVGIDGASHRGAVRALGRTVAVLGSGLDVLFPREHTGLAREIAEHGLLVSEYPPDSAPERYHFPRRNRIIAGLSVGTLVVEATRRSGSLITARFAADYGREVFAIPGSIHNPLARGCHALIRQGAKLVEEGADVLVELAELLQIEQPVQRERVACSAVSPMLEDPAYGKLLEALDFMPTTVTELVDRAGLTAAEVSSMLLMLELEGFVEALPGGRYSRLAKRS